MKLISMLVVSTGLALMGCASIKDGTRIPATDSGQLGNRSFVTDDLVPVYCELVGSNALAIKFQRLSKTASHISIWNDKAGQSSYEMSDKDILQVDETENSLVVYANDHNQSILLFSDAKSVGSKTQNLKDGGSLFTWYGYANINPAINGQTKFKVACRSNDL